MSTSLSCGCKLSDEVFYVLAAVFFDSTEIHCVMSQQSGLRLHAKQNS